jgi:hypothetical protein
MLKGMRGERGGFGGFVAGMAVSCELSVINCGKRSCGGFCWNSSGFDSLSLMWSLCAGPREDASVGDSRSAERRGWMD